MSSKKETWEPCPRCGSKRVQARGGCFMVILGLGVMSLGIWLLLVPILGVIAGPITMLVGLLLLITSPFARNQLQCQDCHKTWKYPYPAEHEQSN